jgi:hypothetical protein
MVSSEITVPELAKRLGIRIPRAQALIREGKIRGRKAKSGWVTTEDALQAYVAQHTTRQSAESKQTD